MGAAKRDGGLGFRDMHSFNLALLSKQCSRLVKFLNSLVNQGISYKYFSGDSFLNVKIGYRPSFVWKSLLAGRKVLNVGLIWSIGDGKTTRIWKDKWIAKPRHSHDTIFCVEA